MIYEIFKNPNLNRLAIVSEAGNVFYLPAALTVRETEEIIYALYGEHVNWDKTAIRIFNTDEFAYALRHYTSQNPEKTLVEILNPDNLRAYAEDLFREASWHDIQDAKEF